jgi:hypothetical protein
LGLIKKFNYPTVVGVSAFNKFKKTYSWLNNLPLLKWIPLLIIN